MSFAFSAQPDCDVSAGLKHCIADPAQGAAAFPAQSFQKLCVGDLLFSQHILEDMSMSDENARRPLQ
jgi:hypothetical protein